MNDIADRLWFAVSGTHIVLAVLIFLFRWRRLVFFCLAIFASMSSHTSLFTVDLFVDENVCFANYFEHFKLTTRNSQPITRVLSRQDGGIPIELASQGGQADPILTQGLKDIRDFLFSEGAKPRATKKELNDVSPL